VIYTIFLKTVLVNNVRKYLAFFSAVIRCTREFTLRLTDSLVYSLYFFIIISMFVIICIVFVETGSVCCSFGF